MDQYYEVIVYYSKGTSMKYEVISYYYIYYTFRQVSSTAIIFQLKLRVQSSFQS